MPKAPYGRLPFIFVMRVGVLLCIPSGFFIIPGVLLVYNYKMPIRYTGVEPGGNGRHTNAIGWFF